MTYDPQTSDNPIYVNALQRAHDEGIVVTLLESWGAHVTSSKGGEGFYTVRFQAHTTTCNCSAGQAGTYCKHRALVHEARVQMIQAREAGKALAAPKVAERDGWNAGARMTDRAWKNDYAQAALESPEPAAPTTTIVLDEPEPSAVAQAQMKSIHNHKVAKNAPSQYALPHDGKYTIVGLDGGHLTIDIDTPKNGFGEGNQVARYLHGPDNTDWSNYTGFAFITPDGDIRMWKKFADNTRLRAGLGILLQKDQAAAAGEAYALESGRCYICGRTLTVPASIHRGMGPECASKVGL